MSYPTAEWIDPKTNSTFFMCVCEHEAIKLDHVNGWLWKKDGTVVRKEADSVYLSMYRYGSEGAAMPLWQRIKAAADVLFHGHLNNDCIILKEHEWDAFVAQINKIDAEYEDGWKQTEEE